MMEVIHTPLEGLLILRPRIFQDERGHFLETFSRARFEEATGSRHEFVQDNESVSSAHVLRGLHFQEHPHAQGKLVHVVQGAVLDVCVDIRPNSPTFGQHFKVMLDARTKDLLWIPPGFAHGFVAQQDHTVFAYKCTAYYSPAAERTLLWNDPDLAIDWATNNPLVSPKDAAGMTFQAYQRVLQTGS